MKKISTKSTLISVEVTISADVKRILTLPEFYRNGKISTIPNFRRSDNFPLTQREY